MKKRNALITGGARGIGAAATTALAKRGYRVFINYIKSSDAANCLAQAIQSTGGEAYTIQADVRKGDQIECMFTEIDRHGGVDILVSNANMHFETKPFMVQSWNEFSEKLNNEMHASYVTAKHAAEGMIKRKFGRLIFISSILSRHPSPNFIAHGSAKSALDTFSKYLAQELGPLGITSNVVAPGLVLTDATKDTPEDLKEMIRQYTPTQRIATPEDVANVVCYLASDESSHLTGTYTPVCGGTYLP